MNKWNIDITLKGSGIVKQCVYRGPEDNIHDVTNKIFGDKHDNYFVDLYDKNEKSIIFTRLSEIATIEVYNRKVVSV